MPSVGYSSFCCPKDMERATDKFLAHMDSHRHEFDEELFVFQRCSPSDEQAAKVKNGKCCFGFIHDDKHYEKILNEYGIKTPDPLLDSLTHGNRGHNHYWQHHCVNHLFAARNLTSDYIVFADADCYIKDHPDGPSWVSEAINLLEADPTIFVVSPSDGGPERKDTMMSQQMFLIKRESFLNMEFIPWDGKFIEKGPFPEFYGLLEGWIWRHMHKRGLYRKLMSPEYRWWHLEWH